MKARDAECYEWHVEGSGFPEKHGVVYLQAFCQKVNMVMGCFIKRKMMEKMIISGSQFQI